MLPNFSDRPLPSPDAQAPVGTNTPATADEQARLAKRKELTPLQLTDEQTRELWKQVKASDELIKTNGESWKILLKEYLPIVKASGDPETIKVPAHYYHTQTKLPQLFYRSPEIACIARGPAKTVTLPPGAKVPYSAEDSGVIAIKQAVLNWYLGPENIDASRVMDECLFDAVAWSGIFAVKVGYRATMKTIEVPVHVPDPAYIPPHPAGIGLSPQAPPPMVPAHNPDGTPKMQQKVVPIFEEIYAYRISPLKIRFNADLASGQFDKQATWVGQRFSLPKDVAEREFALSEDELSKTGDDEWVFKDDRYGKPQKVTSNVNGIELWRKAALVRPDEQPHPQALDHIVLIDGLPDYPVVCQPSPDQSFDDQGRLTPDSLIGFPLHIGSLTDLADSPLPPADNAFTNGQVKELNTYRRQEVLLRDRAIGKQFYDSSHLEDTELDILKNGDVAEPIAVKPGALAKGSGAILSNTAQVTQTADTYRGQEILKQDMQTTIGLGSGQVGATTDTVRPATELAQMAQATASRVSKTQDRALEFFIGIARKVDALIMRYGPKSPEYVSVAGQDGAKDVFVWNRQLISGRYAYDILPDSSWKLDNTQLFRMRLSLYNLAKGDPLFNRGPVLRQLTQELGYNPSQVVMTPEQIAQQAMQGTQQPAHQQGGADTHEERRTGDRPNNPSSGNPSRVM